MNLRKALPAIGFIFGLLLTTNEGDYFPLVNVMGLFLFGLSALKLNKIRKEEECKK